MKRVYRGTIIAIGVLLACAAAVFLIAPDKRKLDDSVRAETGSLYVELSEGVTEYEIAGPASGPRVILVHGLSVPMYDWDSQFTDLAARGFRVVRYNQYGRGYSDRPRGKYNGERYVGQLYELMDEQGWESAHLVGHSMGCAVVARFAVAHPESVDRIVLISPTLHIAEDNAGVRLARMPVIGDIASKLAMAPILTSRADELFTAAGVAGAEEYLTAFKEQTRYRGFTRSVKSLFRSDMVEDLSGVYAQLDGSRVLAIWGTDDESVPTEHYETLRNLLPETEPTVFNGAGHMPNMERADEVNRLVASFLRGDV